MMIIDLNVTIAKDTKLLPIEIESDEPELESDLHRKQTWSLQPRKESKSWRHFCDRQASMPC